MTIISDDDNFQNEHTHAKKTVREKSRAADVEPVVSDFDKSFETGIRPKKFDEYIGQSALKSTLKITIEAAKKRGKPLDHLLFFFFLKQRRTTLYVVIANELNTQISIKSTPALERPRDIIGILMSLKDSEILFIDEIHRLNKVAEEILYPAMEDFFLDMTTGKAQTVKTLRVPLPKFTLIGATTKAGALSGPLRDRFGIIHRLQFYTKEELAMVVSRTAALLDINITKDGAFAIAARSRGTPRIANRLIKRVGDYALVKGSGCVDETVANAALDTLHIDKCGLDTTDRDLMTLIIEKYDGGPVGIETLAAALGEDVKTIEDVYEPYLLQEGFLQRTPRGRKVSPEGFRHLGYKPRTEQKSLF